MPSRRPNSAFVSSRAAPGPGAYDATEMGKPNAYVLSGVGRSPPGCKIGTENRSNFLGGSNRTPGPGTYAPTDQIMSQKSAAPNWRIGSSQRGPLSYVGTAPGPGAYAAKDSIGEGPKSSMRPRTAVMLRNGNPGPGTYTTTVDPINKRPPTAVMGKDLRGNNFAGLKNAPGPGAYLSGENYGEKKWSSPSYSFGRERPHTGNGGGPGPGSHRVPCTFAELPRYVLPTETGFEFV